ncbi:MAG: AAA family ATPase [Promethearchaeota archaeon]|jgi:AAA15 family ATPase/GTPase
MFVRSLDITEFRGIKNCKKPLIFSNFTILIGKNNAGKSSVLEALSLLPDPGVYDYITRVSKIQNLLRLHDGSVKDLFYLYAGSSNLKYVIENTTAIIEITERKQHINWRNPNTTIKRIVASNPDKKSELVLFIPFNTSIIRDIESRMGTLKELIMKKGYHIELANFLNECVNDVYSELVFLQPISLRKIYPDNKVYLKLKDLGTGAEKLIKIMALFEVLDPRLIIIDDFEAGFHPTMVKLFLKWLKKKKFQTIISTHSIDVLYHLVDIKPSDTTILQLNKSNEDVLSSEVLNLEELEDLLDANTDPRLLLDALRL